MEKYTIRPAEQADTDALLELSRSVINHNFRSFMGDAAVDGFLDSGMADKEITDALNDIVVLEDQSRIIGLCIWKSALLHLLMVAPDCQGTGAAAYFIERLCTEKFKVYPELHLECFETNTRAVSFYENCNWQLERSELGADVGLVRLVYSKRDSQN